MIGYFHTPVRKTYQLKVSKLHTLMIEECGVPFGIPVVFLHGGPGGSISEKSRRFFDPKRYRIILFDQRGCGASTPTRELKDNTVFHSVEDLEKIRKFLGIDRWIVFGGSYGSTLALTYAIMHPELVMALVLRGIFLGRQSDIDWMIEKGGASEFYPEEYEQFAQLIPETSRHQLVQSYFKMMTEGTAQERDEAAKRWAEWESGQVTLQPDFSGSPVALEWQKTIGLLEAAYFAHGFFPGKSDNFILDHAYQLQNIPMAIVHGRFDTICRPSGAYDLAKACPHARFSILEESSHASEAHMFRKLVEIMDDLALKFSD
ncbi:prolyl aminopeptidase [Allofustis seminis]|uniref:prolyl aminopeptidase n=1 Tax=Allofustis seminis TaxID=166939 RepID=UPI00037728F7|nr:prolyl aminopeptidase [Allofustis seminis]